MRHRPAETSPDRSPQRRTRALGFRYRVHDSSVGDVGIAPENDLRTTTHRVRNSRGGPRAPVHLDHPNDELSSRTAPFFGVISVTPRIHSCFDSTPKSTPVDKFPGDLPLSGIVCGNTPRGIIFVLARKHRQLRRADRSDRPLPIRGEQLAGRAYEARVQVDRPWSRVCKDLPTPREGGAKRP